MSTDSTPKPVMSASPYSTTVSGVGTGKDSTAGFTITESELDLQAPVTALASGGRTVPPSVDLTAGALQRDRVKASLTGTKPVTIAPGTNPLTIS